MKKRKPSKQKNEATNTPEVQERIEIDFEECLRLKEITRNRLKLIHPPESRAEKTSSEIYKILEIQPPRKKAEIKPFSDRITNPFAFKVTERPKTAPPERPRIPLQEALDFARRQNEWLTRKNEIEIPEKASVVKLDQVQATQVNSLQSWKRALSASQKNQMKERKSSIAREKKLQRKVEEAKVLKQKQKLEKLVSVEPSLQPILDEINEKLFKIRHGSHSLKLSIQTQSILDVYDDPFSIPIDDEYDSFQHSSPASSSLHINSSRTPIPNINSGGHTPRAEDSDRILPPQVETAMNLRSQLQPPQTKVEMSIPSPSLPIRPQSASSDSDIPVPQLDPDGRVISLYHSGRLIDDWDRLSDSSEEPQQPEPQEAFNRKHQLHVDVHAFLQSVYRRSEVNDDSSQSSGDDDDESASVY